MAKVKRGVPEAAPDPSEHIDEIPQLAEVKPAKPKGESSSARAKREKEEHKARQERKAQGRGIVVKIVGAACQYGTMRQRIAPLPDPQVVALGGATAELLDHYGMLDAGAHPAVVFAVVLGSCMVYVKNAPEIPEEDAVAYYGEGASKYYQEEEASDVEVASVEAQVAEA
jgi:hypothetical protein